MSTLNFKEHAREMGVLMEYAIFFAITFNLKNYLRNNGRGGKPKNEQIYRPRWQQIDRERES